MIDTNDAHLRSETRSARQIGALLATRVLLQHIRIRNLAVSARTVLLQAYGCFHAALVLWLLIGFAEDFILFLIRSSLVPRETSVRIGGDGLRNLHRFGDMD
jgi:hypothetical protein